MKPEPDNCFDANAIAFEIQINDEWRRVGYLVSEVLQAVHHAIENQAIQSVRLEWVKFITHWSRSTPGWYCRINIEKIGPWTKDVLRYKSTV